MQMQMYYDLAALPLAFALNGVPRLLIIAAWFLIEEGIGGESGHTSGIVKENAEASVITGEKPQLHKQ